MPDRLGRLAGALVLGASGTLAGADVIYVNNFNSGVAGSEWSSQKVTATNSTHFGTFLGNFGQQTVRLTIDQPAVSGGGDDGSGGGDSGSGGGGSGGGSGVVGGSTAGPISGNRSGQRGGGLGGGLHRFQSRPIFGGGGGGGGGDGGGGGSDGGDNGGGGDGGGGQPGEPRSYTLKFDLYLFDSWDGYDPTYGVDRFIVNVNGVAMFSEVLETFDPRENRLTGWSKAGSDAFDTRYPDILYRNLTVSFTMSDPAQAIVIDFVGATTQVMGDESWGLDNVYVVANSTSRSNAVPAAPTALVALGGLLAGSRRRR